MKAMPSPRKRNHSLNLPAWGFNLIIGVLAAILIGFLILSGLLADGARVIGDLLSGAIPGLLLIGLLLAAYFLPTIIAWRTPRMPAMAVANLLLGWTILFWVITLIWAIAEQCSKKPTPPPLP